VPALFSYQYFVELLQLKGQEGAKVLLNKFPENLTTIAFDNGELDIDTLDDYTKLTGHAITNRN
jgi:molybdenum cofactor cytidylyltransferase